MIEHRLSDISFFISKPYPKSFFICFQHYLYYLSETMVDINFNLNKFEKFETLTQFYINSTMIFLKSSPKIPLAIFKNPKYISKANLIVGI
jgi:hypothetical protein